MVYDLAIIGGGPAGYVAAEKAGESSLSVILFEKNKLGGVCLNEGCIPTKSLLYSAKIYEHALAGEAYGINVENVSIDLHKIISRKDRVSRRLVAGIALKMKQYGVTVVNEEAYIYRQIDDTFAIKSASGDQFLCKNLLICTGSSTNIPNIKGLDLSDEHIVTHRELLQLKERPDKLVVIGGGVIGIEFASFFNSIGSNVTVIEMLPEILLGMDNDLACMLREIYAKKGIEFKLLSRVTEINNGCVTYSDSEGIEHSIESSKVLISVGRRPSIEGFGLDNLSVTVEHGAIKVDNKMRTNIPGVFAAGDVTGLSLLAHAASRQGEVIVNNLVGIEDTMNYHAIPNVVYTNPEVASVGLTEQRAVNMGIEFKTATIPMTYSGRFMVENTDINGLCKFLISPDGTILGIHLLGNPSSEIIWGMAYAIDNKMKISEIDKIIFPHPTVSEIIKSVLPMLRENL